MTRQQLAGVMRLIEDHVLESCHPLRSTSARIDIQQICEALHHNRNRALNFTRFYEQMITRPVVSDEILFKGDWREIAERRWLFWISRSWRSNATSRFSRANYSRLWQPQDAAMAWGHARATSDGW